LWWVKLVTDKKTVGIMADSHDNLMAIDKAVEEFNKRSVSYVIHAGDIISPFTVNNLKKLNSDLYLVFGNNDGEKKGLVTKFQDFASHLGEIGSIELDGIKIAVYHGTHPQITDALLNSQKYDYVVTGHIHQQKIEQVGKTTLINPGETCGYLTGKKTIALLNLETKEIESIEL